MVEMVTTACVPVPRELVHLANALKMLTGVLVEISSLPRVHRGRIHRIHGKEGYWPVSTEELDSEAAEEVGKG